MITLDHCSWDRPGADPFGGDVPAAVADYAEIPAPARIQLRAKMERHQYDDVVEIRRDTIIGMHVYSDMRSMHYGSKLCKAVSRAKWADDAVERGLVYCVAEHCLIVPSVCTNLSLVTRVPKVIRGDFPAPILALPEPLPPLELPSEPPTVMPPVSDDVPPTHAGPAAPPFWWPPVYVPSPPGPAAPPAAPPSPQIPEPATWALIVAGIAAVAARRRFA